MVMVSLLLLPMVQVGLSQADPVEGTIAFTHSAQLEPLAKSTGNRDVDSKPCIAGRCQNGWHDLSKTVWDCVNSSAQTDAEFQSAIRSACAGHDLDVHYQTCTAPCCKCWSTYWPAYIQLWGRCGAPASYVDGEARTGLKAKEEWLCGTGVWGECVAVKWKNFNFTECTSKPDRIKLQEVFGLFRDRRYIAESCSCLHQATNTLEHVMQQCQVPDRDWFVKYGKRRLNENFCGMAPVATEEVSAAPLPGIPSMTALMAMIGIAVACAAGIHFAKPRRHAEGQVPFLA
mmetsp:Transcript_138682/g.386746  ORF Transcript_138682/g.386746 Transcript_138682/m.386746 type:complete len:287 (+) Transcript_138682:98-958(+)